ncbi:MAG TPA: NADPH:quinone reductase [Sinomonas sp.]|nr:NADPH:quinone reductase [Sinomonas sp.]
MRAAWYTVQGPAADTLTVGELPDPSPGPGEVRVRLRFSGVNPGDIKKRQGWLGSSMPYPRVIPHSDGAGVIDAVGDGVPPERMGRRVWVYGAQSYRPFGTAAEYTVVPDLQAVDLPDGVSDEVGATLGIPGITAHRAVFADGEVAGHTVLVQGALGAVGSFAWQLALAGGATVIATVRRGPVPEGLGIPVVALDGADAAERIRELAPGGVDRIIEVSLSDNADLDSKAIAPNGVIAAYGSSDGRPTLPFWPLLFDNVTLRLFGSDDFPPAAKTEAATMLSRVASTGQLHPTIRLIEPLERIASAHAAVENSHALGRVLVSLPEVP